MKMTFFFGDDNPLSNWHPAPFVLKGIRFQNSEQMMMFCKARLFGDEQCADMILHATTPRAQKALGRQVKNFNQEVWDQRCEQYVFIGNLAKFSQNQSLAKFLLNTGDTELVEASPYDKIWGVGLRESDPRIHNKSTWQGENRLGKVLMKVRDALEIQILEMKEVEA